jgi:hypothetical protein
MRSAALLSYRVLSNVDALAPGGRKLGVPGFYAKPCVANRVGSRLLIFQGRSASISTSAHKAYLQLEPLFFIRYKMDKPVPFWINTCTPALWLSAMHAFDIGKPLSLEARPRKQK